MQGFAGYRSQAGQSSGVDGLGDQLWHQIGQHGPGLDGHDLPQAVDGVVVYALALLKLKTKLAK